MPPYSCQKTEVYIDEQKYSDPQMVLDPNLSSMAYLPSLPTLDNNNSSFCFFSSSLEETRNHESQKLAPLTDYHESFESSTPFSSGRGSTSGNSNSFQKLHFRDHVWAYTQRFLAVEAMDMGFNEYEESVEEERSRDGMKLVQQLIACAEAVACRDKSFALALLSELRPNALVFGTSFQRVASCFVQGLSDRLEHELVHPLVSVGVTAKMMNTTANSPDKDEALRLVYEICPQIQFGHFIANASILEAFEGERCVHVVDLGMSLGLSHGYQWRNLMQSLANRTRGRVPLQRLRITGVGNRGERLEEIGKELEVYAGSLKLGFFQFSMVEIGNLENLKPEDLGLSDGEVLVINSILHLHCVAKESKGALNSILKMLHRLSPKLMVLVEQDSSHNGPFFLGRFMEALHYYSAIFDSLDAMLPKYDTRRAKIEQFHFAEEIKNIVSCEGQARVERHETMDQWRRRMSRAGFQQSPLKMMTKTKQWLEKVSAFEGYRVMEEKGCLFLGWKSKPIISASCWKSS